MKKFVVFFLLILSFSVFISGCKNVDVDNEVIGTEDIIEEEIIDEVVDSFNRDMLANVLGVEENAYEISSLLSALHSIKAGKLLNIELIEDENNIDRFLNVVTEDGINYHIGISRGNYLEYVRNVDTDEWLMMSIE